MLLMKLPFYHNNNNKCFCSYMRRYVCSTAQNGTIVSLRGMYEYSVYIANAYEVYIKVAHNILTWRINEMVPNTSVPLSGSISTAVRASGTVLCMLCAVKYCIEYNSTIHSFETAVFSMRCTLANACKFNGICSKWINKCQFNLFMSTRSEFMCMHCVIANNTRPIFAPLSQLERLTWYVRMIRHTRGYALACFRKVNYAKN